MEADSRSVQIVQETDIDGNLLRAADSSVAGGGIYIPHFNGIVISPYAYVGDDVKLLQQVTIGVDFEKDPTAAPAIGRGTLIGAGAKIIGKVQIGENCRIGANAIVTKDVPDGKTVVGVNKILN